MNAPLASLPSISRDQWAEHPHFPEQVLLLGSHENFRRVSDYLVQQAQESADPLALRSLYRRWISAMRSHEGYEEHKLYPYMARRWNASFDEAEAGHHALHEKHASVLHAFEAVGKSSGAAARAELVQALQEHDAVLVAHLRLEEDLVIPMLLSLTPAEFRDYSHSSIGRLLHAMDAAAAEDAGTSPS